MQYTRLFQCIITYTKIDLLTQYAAVCIIIYVTINCKTTLEKIAMHYPYMEIKYIINNNYATEYRVTSTFNLLSVH